MGQHLGFNDKSNVLRQHLINKGIAAEKCDFRLLAYGPILVEAATQDEHRMSRDIIAGLEKALENSMKESGYNVLNTVNCKKALDPDLWSNVRKAFAEYFHKLEVDFGRKQ